ncbi:MAG: hypothetical protein NW220_18355 [Leptolyngbyaceae cyanobacterium bins.349]|nr:hypothetical protein [Leptolyngbyaceae cyanobacterium bins.349]
MTNVQPAPARSLLMRWCSRSQLVLLLGTLLLGLGAIAPWYQLPGAAVPVFGVNPLVLNLGRGVAGLFACLSLLIVLGLAQKSMIRLLYLVGLLMTLLFPYYITNWCPNVSFLAHSYYEQGNQISLHVDKFASEMQAQWGQTIRLDQPTEVPSTWTLAISDSRFFQLPAWQSIWIDGMGYSNSFFQFIGRGWFVTIAGLSAVLFGLYLSLEAQGLDGVLQDLRYFLPGAGLVLGILLGLLLCANLTHYRLETLFAKGDYPQVVTDSAALIRWYPAAQGDVDFMRRWAIASAYSQPTNESLTQFAQGLERYARDDFSAAEQAFRQALELTPRSFLVRGYLASAILQQGVNYINDTVKKPAAAAAEFEQVLQIFPLHLAVLYDLMLARTLNGEFEPAARVAQQIIQSQKPFQQPEMALLGRAYTQLSWSGYHDDHIIQAWERYRQSVDPQTWNALEDEG